MGRKKIELTSEQIQERKQRWWGPERNARRRARYQQDCLFRERTIQTVRGSYRRQKEEHGVTVRQNDCRANLARLHEIGQLRTCSTSSDKVLTFTIDEIAIALFRNTQVLYRWISSGMVPAPAAEALNGRNRWQTIYTQAEARALLETFGDHQARSQYYRTFHTETRNRLFAAVEAARS